MRFNTPVAAADYAKIARAIGVATESQTDEYAAGLCIDALFALFARVGMPATINEIGVTDAKLDQIAELSMNAARLIENNPRTLSPDAIKSILVEAMAS